MDELMAQFIIEARELVQAAIDDLFVLESEPGNGERLNAAFRAVHTLKGSTGLFDLGPLQTVLHLAEDNLGAARSGHTVLDAGQIDALVAVLEWIDRCVDDLERSGAVSADNLARSTDLQAALDQGEIESVAPIVAAASTSIAWALDLSARFGGSAAVALRYTPHAECFFSGDDPVTLVATIPGLVHLAVQPHAAWPAPDAFDPFRSNLTFEALSTASLSDIEAVFRLVPDQVEIVPLGASPAIVADESNTEATDPAEATRTLRIEAARIDALLDMVGELMTSKNAMAGLVSDAAALSGGADLARSMAATKKDLDRLAASLYGAVLQTRMVALSQAFRRLPRLVRDLSRRLGKPTDLVIEGDGIEADKTIVDELFEPLLHLVRNAMDHGIELPPQRFAAGKPPVAKLSLRVTRAGEQIVVALSDDGRGIDPAAIRQSAIAKGIVTAERAASLSDAATLDLLFAAGFSTASSISDLSGRGVGLDAVRTEIARLGGSVAIESRIGEGTSINLRLPVSFAMTQLLVVTVDGERYGVPMPSVVETVRVALDGITPIRAGRAFVLRSRTVPLLSLSGLLDLPDAAPSEKELTVLVLDIHGEPVGIIIDAIAERLETVTRPLGGVLRGIRGIAGTTVLGDGRVLLVLDVAGLIG